MLPQLQCRENSAEELLVLPGFEHKVGSAILHGFYGRVYFAISGNENDDGLRVQA